MNEEAVAFEDVSGGTALYCSTGCAKKAGVQHPQPVPGSDLRWRKEGGGPWECAKCGDALPKRPLGVSPDF
jgi:hypothetical protein